MVYMIAAVARDTKYGPEVMLPVLLRPGRGVYGMFIRDTLTEAGFTDMPANGGYVLGLIESRGSGLSDVIADLGVSKQTASQLVDTLVVRGYLERSVDPDDRRRVLVTLTAAAGGPRPTPCLPLSQRSTRGLSPRWVRTV